MPETKRHSSPSLHDRVVRSVAQRLSGSRFDVVINPGSERNKSFGGLYPDVVLTRPGQTVPQAVMEAETEESLKLTGTLPYWSRCAGLGAPLYILVPHAQRREAEEKILHWRPLPLVGTYRLGRDGGIKFDFMP